MRSPSEAHRFVATNTGIPSLSRGDFNLTDGLFGVRFFSRPFPFSFHLLGLGLEVPLVVRIRGNHKRKHFDDFHPSLPQIGDLFWIVGHQSNLIPTQRFADFTGYGKTASIPLMAQFLIGLKRIEPLLLQVVRFQFFDQTDASSLLPQVNHCTSLLSNLFQGMIQLGTAIAFQRPHHISGPTFRVDPHQRDRTGFHRTLQHQVRLFFNPTWIS